MTLVSKLQKRPGDSKSAPGHGGNPETRKPGNPIWVSGFPGQGVLAAADLETRKPGRIGFLGFWVSLLYRKSVENI